jgi:hypothetical protein
MAIPPYALRFGSGSLNQKFSIRVHHLDRDVAALIDHAAMRVFRSCLVIDFP